MKKNMSGIKNFEPALAHPVAKATWAFQQFVGASISISFAMLKETNGARIIFESNNSHGCPCPTLPLPDGSLRIRSFALVASPIPTCHGLKSYILKRTTSKRVLAVGEQTPTPPQKKHRPEATKQTKPADVKNKHTKKT